MSLANEEEGEDVADAKDKQTKQNPQEERRITEPLERDRYSEPREKDDPEHKDAGQLYVEQNPTGPVETEDDEN